MYNTAGGDMIKVLFVCTGNICRSPTAEGVFRHLAEQADLEGAFFIDSAGTSSGHVGQAPDARAIRVAEKHGVALTGQKARNLDPSDFGAFDHIYAMDGGHLAALKKRAPGGARAELRMFLDGADVPDPWYGDERDFEHAYALIRSGAESLLAKLRKEYNL